MAASKPLATSKLVRSPSALQLLHRSEVSAIYKEPFILSGYRQPECTYADCLRYTLVLHNEVGNFWTHFLPIWIWVLWILRLPPDIDLSDPYFYPLLSYWAGACAVHLFSSIAHGFACKSSTVRDVTTMLDYLGIAVYSFGGAIIAFYYQWPRAYYIVFSYKPAILCILVVACSNVTVLTCLSLYYWPKNRYLVRAMAAAVAYSVTIIPWMSRFRICAMTGTDCDPDTFHFHFTNLTASIAAGILFTSKFPERFAPGRFDFFGQSHQLFHVAITIQTTAELYALPQVALQRRAELSAIPNFSPDFSTCVLPHLIVLGVGVATMSLLGLLVSRGLLVSHRRKCSQIKVE